jgi:hypothetical protein
MTWGKLAGFCSLKAIVVACVITPVTVPATGITAAHAQFNIIIPGLNIHPYGGRRYYRSRGYNRSARRGGRRGQQQQEATSSSSSSGPSTQNLSAPSSSSGPQTAPRGYRQSTD